jgi:hypothetical protein
MPIYLVKTDGFVSVLLKIGRKRKSVTGIMQRDFKMVKRAGEAGSCGTSD